MKERKTYEVPSITVIAMDDHADIIQTSTQVQTLANIGTYGVDIDLNGLFNTNGTN